VQKNNEPTRPPEKYQEKMKSPVIMPPSKIASKLINHDFYPIRIENT